MSRLIDTFPLHEYGDKIVEAMAEYGIPHGGVSITITNVDDGSVSGTSNLPDELEMSLLGFLMGERLAGRYTEEVAPTDGETMQ